MAHRTLLPGQPGTKNLQKKYGEKLLCVRYRYDTEKGQKIKTVELIVEKQDWKPSGKNSPPNKTTYLKIEYGEIELARKIKSIGGRWNRQKKLWELPLRQVKILNLEHRIINIKGP